MEVWIIAIGSALGLIFKVANMWTAERGHAEQRLSRRRRHWNRGRFDIPVEESDDDADDPLWE